jgi:small nuclear ribonucleoprotein (snRNP)-like protein
MNIGRQVLTVGLAVWLPIVSLQGQSLADTTLIQQQVTGLGVGADVKVKLADGKKLRGRIQGITDQSFQLALKREGTSEAIAYDQVAELGLTDLYYKAKGSPDAAEARRTVVGLGIGKHVLVKYGSGIKIRGTIEMIDTDHFAVLRDHQSTSLQVSYDDTWQAQPNLSRAAKMLIGVGAFLTFIVILGALVSD